MPSAAQRNTESVDDSGAVASVPVSDEAANPVVVESTESTEAVAGDALRTVGRLMDILADQKVLDHADAWVNSWASIQKDKLDKQQKSNELGTDKQYRLTVIHLVARYSLAVIVVGAIVYLGVNPKTLEPQALAVLLGGVVGSLFVQPRGANGSE